MWTSHKCNTWWTLTKWKHQMIPLHSSPELTTLLHPTPWVSVVSFKDYISSISFCYLGLTSFTQGIVWFGLVACSGGPPFLFHCCVVFHCVNSPHTIYPPCCWQAFRLLGCFLVFVVMNNIKQSSKQWYINNTCVISSYFSLSPRCPLGVEF